MSVPGYCTVYPESEVSLRMMPIFFAVLTSFLASRFAIAQEDQEDLESLIKEENEQIRAEIAELRTLITQQRDKKE